MTLIREGGMQRGRMLRVPAGASPAHYSCCRSGTQAKRTIRYLANWSLGCTTSPWHVTAVRCACGFAWAQGSVLITSHPLLCGERAGSKLLILTLSLCFRQEDSLNYWWEQWRCRLSGAWCVWRSRSSRWLACWAWGLWGPAKTLGVSFLQKVRTCRVHSSPPAAPCPAFFPPLNPQQPHRP